MNEMHHKEKPTCQIMNNTNFVQQFVNLFSISVEIKKSDMTILTNYQITNPTMSVVIALKQKNGECLEIIYGYL